MLCFLFFQWKGDFSILIRVIFLGKVKFLACLCAQSQCSLALVINCHSLALCCKEIEQFAGQGSLSTTRLGVSRNWQPPGWVVVRLNSNRFLAALPDELLAVSPWEIVPRTITISHTRWKMVGIWIFLMPLKFPRGTYGNWNPQKTGCSVRLNQYEPNQRHWEKVDSKLRFV